MSYILRHLIKYALVGAFAVLIVIGAVPTNIAHAFESTGVFPVGSYNTSGYVYGGTYDVVLIPYDWDVYFPNDFQYDPDTGLPEFATTTIILYDKLAYYSEGATVHDGLSALHCYDFSSTANTNLHVIDLSLGVATDDQWLYFECPQGFVPTISNTSSSGNTLEYNLVFIPKYRLATSTPVVQVGYRDWLIAVQWIIFLLSFILWGVLFSPLRKSKSV